MCRNIKQLRIPQGLPSDEEIAAAALQYIRKVSGYRKPSKRNQAAFELAVEQVAGVTKSLLNSLQQNTLETHQD